MKRFSGERRIWRTLRYVSKGFQCFGLGHVGRDGRFVLCCPSLLATALEMWRCTSPAYLICPSGYALRAVLPFTSDAVS